MSAFNGDQDTWRSCVSQIPRNAATVNNWGTLICQRLQRPYLRSVVFIVHTYFLETVSLTEPPVFVSAQPIALSIGGPKLWSNKEVTQDSGLYSQPNPVDPRPVALRQALRMSHEPPAAAPPQTQSLFFSPILCISVAPCLTDFH